MNSQTETSNKPNKEVSEVKALPVQRDANDWIAEVSHELRLPIANIKLLVETLLDGAMDDADAARRMLLRAKTEADRLQNLVVTLLSQEQLTRREVTKQWVDLGAKVASALHTVNKLATEKKIKIDVRIKPDCSIYANPEMLEQVLVNLLENAIKFTPTSGKVVINSGEEPGVFSISDTGIGMPEPEIPKIFQRFYRIDRSHSRGSTGLGLSIVKHIADLHGAKINVASQEGKGSIFTLDFPQPENNEMKRI